jgi:hypothetical protein
MLHVGLPNCCTDVHTVLTCLLLLLLLLLLLHAEGLLPGFRVVINDGPEGCE